MVIAGAEDTEVAEGLKGNGVFGSAKAGGGSVAGDFAFSDVVSSLRTEEETIPAEDGVGSQSRALSDNGQSAFTQH